MSNSKLEKISPQDLDAEKSVLGSILIDTEAFIKVSDLLQPVDFYVQVHQDIYDVMFYLWSHSTPIDLITMSTRLKEQKKLTKIGGRAFLIELTEIVPSSSNIFRYAQTVKKNSTLRKLLRTGQDLTAMAYDTETDLSLILEKAEKSLFAVTQNFIRNKLVHISEILQDRYEEFAELHDSDEEIVHGLQSGFSQLDKILGGMKPADLLIVAARPSVGKTALAINIALNVALHDGKKVAIFSLEMSKEQLVDRMFSAVLAVDSYKLHNGKLADQDFARMGEAMDKLSRADIFIDDSVAGNLTEIKSKCRRLQMEKGVDLVVIDYLQLLGSGANIAFRVQEISDISRGLKNLARELHIPVMALSQLSRAVEARPDKTPQLSDLRESGSIEQDADVVTMLYRESYYDPDCDHPEKLDIIVRKNRNGALGTASVAFHKEKMQFVDYDYSHDNF